MTIEEAREIIRNAQPIEYPKSGNTVSIQRQKITSFKDLFNGRKKRTTANQESGETQGC